MKYVNLEKENDKGLCIIKLIPTPSTVAVVLPNKNDMEISGSSKSIYKVYIKPAEVLIYLTGNNIDDF